MGCFYNIKRHCVQKMTKEHVVSNAVLKVAFGDPIRNVARAKHFGNKALLDHEALVKDVCETCNNVSLNPYDVAGKQLVTDLQGTQNSMPLQLRFNNDTLGWILKTHFNYFRVVKDVETAQAYKIKQVIKQALIERKKVDPTKYVLMVQQWEEQPHYWDASSVGNIPYLNYRSIRFKEQRIVMSNFRIRQLDTILMLPSDADYKNFSGRVESAIKEMQSEFNADFEILDIEQILDKKSITVSSLLTISEIEAMVSANN
ncbi:hypothetical protein, partial [Vibrio lentus]|uniref:hypothetical protein n=1 Tax=Vibrio lentus TaxID=136468 RepID=UPI001055638F